jgi:hypothetical protein
MSQLKRIDNEFKNGSIEFTTCFIPYVRDMLKERKEVCRRMNTSRNCFSTNSLNASAEDSNILLHCILRSTILCQDSGSVVLLLILLVETKYHPDDGKICRKDFLKIDAV